MVGMTCTRMVSTLSAPVWAVSVVVAVLSPWKMTPFQNKGNACSHSVLSAVSVTLGQTYSVMVTILSQPVAASSVSDCMHASVKWNPKVSNGRLFSTIVSEMLLWMVGMTCTRMVSTLSAPVWAVSVTRAVLSLWKVTPFQNKGNSRSQRVFCATLRTLGHTCSVMVTMLSHPAALAMVSESVPACVKCMPKVS